MSHWTKCNFSTTDRDFLNQNFSIYSGRRFQQFPKISAKYFRCFKNYNFTVFIPYFKVALKKWTVICNDQCPTSFNSFFSSKHVLTVHLTFHTSSMCFCEAQLLIGSWFHINCKTFFSPSVFFGLR